MKKILLLLSLALTMQVSVADKYDLFLAVDENNISKVKALIDNGADVNAVDKGWTALLIAAEKGYTDMAKALIKAGADVNAAANNSNPL